MEWDRTSMRFMLTSALAFSLVFYYQGGEKAFGQLEGSQLDPNEILGDLLNDSKNSTDTTGPTSPANSNSENLSITGNSASFRTYTNNLYGISLQYPADWRPSANGLRDHADIVAFYSPRQNISDPFTARLKLAVNLYNQEPTLSGYTNHVLTTIKGINGTTIKSAQNTTLAGHPAYRVVVNSNPFPNLQFYTMNVWTVIGNSSILVTYDGEQKRFNQYLSDAAQILASLRIQ
jgi:PsbP-like protein